MMELREAIDLVKLQPPFRPNTLKAWHVIKEAVVNGTLIPDDQCYEVREGYYVAAGSVDDVCECPLSEALTIRSADDVRREALIDAMWNMIPDDTPQPKGGDDE